jgi:transposase
MPRTRKVYTAEFKRQAVLMITQQGLSVAEVARQLDVSENCLRLWKKAYLDQGNRAFPGQGNLSPQDLEIRRLRDENKRLAAERDLLKKAATYFASLTT